MVQAEALILVLFEDHFAIKQTKKELNLNEY